MNNTTQRILKGLFSSGFGQIVTIFSQLACVPLFIHYWGVEKYGEWLIIATVPTYLAISDFGFASVAANEMIMSNARGFKDKALCTFQSILAVILIATFITGIILGIIIYYQIVHSLLPVKNIIGLELSSVIVMLWIQVIISQVGGAISAGYRCDGNFAVGLFYSNILRLCEFLALSISLVLSGGFVDVVFVVLCVRLIGTFIIGAGLRFRSPWLSIGLSKASLREIKRLVRPSLTFMAFPLGHALNLQGFTLVVGSLMGGSAVAIFTTYRTLTNFPKQLMNMINVTIWPELSLAFGQHDVKKVAKLHRLSVASSFWIVLITFIFLNLFGTDIVHLWTSENIPSEKNLIFLLGLVVLLNAVWSTSSMVSLSNNTHEKIALVYFFGCLLSLILAYFLGHFYFLPGVAASLLAIDFAMIFFVFKHSVNITNDRLSPFILSILTFPFDVLIRIVNLIKFK